VAYGKSRSKGKNKGKGGEGGFNTSFYFGVKGPKGGQEKGKGKGKGTVVVSPAMTALAKQRAIITAVRDI